MGPDLLGPSHRRLGLDHRVTLDRVCRVSGREQLDRFRDLRQEQHVGHHDPISHLRAPVAAPVHHRLSAHGETAAYYGVLYDCHNSSVRFLRHCLTLTINVCKLLLKRQCDRLLLTLVLLCHHRPKYSCSIAETSQTRQVCSSTYFRFKTEHSAFTLGMNIFLDT